MHHNSHTLLLRGFLNSYSQILFSNNYFLAILIIIITFFDFTTGLYGAISVILTNIIALLSGLNKQNISEGIYGFNSLLVGLALGNYYENNVELLIIVFIASLITLLITTAISGFLNKYNLPFLTIPFVISIWIVTLATKDYTNLNISERNIFRLNEMYLIGGESLLKIFQWFNNLDINEPTKIYFRSLGAIFFQEYMFPGILICIALFFVSRIASLLSIIGFFSAYFFYKLIGADITILNYHYIGFNFILTSIAIGGFYIIPSKHSFLWTILIIPITSILISATTKIMSHFQLPIYSLPFSTTVLLYLYFLKFRYAHFMKPQEVYYQHYSPEKNLYYHTTNYERFSKNTYIPIILPFFGKWTVTQGHSGKHTHQNEWQYAWDFEILDQTGKNYANNGLVKEDYYCYHKPVISPADGIVETIVDGIEDNPINDVNTNENWGNTIVIKHSPYLYSKISHLSPGSFKVKSGDYVKKGEIIAYCGNSGRSPIPHIHFQLQSVPHIDGKTILYPISHYISYENDSLIYKSFDYPKENEILSNVEPNRLLTKAFHFIPGQKINIKIIDFNNKEFYETWEIYTDPYNNSYFHSPYFKSTLWFVNDGTNFYCTYFYGDKNSPLFYFYLSLYKVLLGYYPNITIHDTLPISILKFNPIIFISDLIAPFYQLFKINYYLKYLYIDDNITTEKITLSSNISLNLHKKKITELKSVIELEKEKIKQITITKSNKSEMQLLFL